MDKKDNTPPKEGGGPDTRFLDLEISKVLYAEALELARPAASELLKEAIKAKVKERLGDRIEALAEAAVERLVDDVESSLRVEREIAAHGKRKAAAEEAVAALFAAPEGGE